MGARARGVGASCGAGSTSPGRAEPTEAGPSVPLRLRAISFFLSFSALYRLVTSVNSKKTSDLLRDEGERKRLATKAHELALDMARASIDVCGTAARQTYLHDAVYGLPQLFMGWGKPYLAATEGHEHQHGEMKKYFHGMCSHSSTTVGDVLQTMNLLHLFRWAVDEFGQFGGHSQ